MAVCFGLPMGGLLGWLERNWPAGIVGGLIGGAIFATILQRFAAHQTRQFSVEPPDFGGEAILFEGPANHFKGGESVGGYLWLTAGQLFFRSHRFNFQNHECRMPLSAIAEVKATRTLGLIPNGLLVRLSSAAEERFVVQKHREWAARIEGASTSGNA